MSPFHKILVPTDFGESSQHALALGIDLASSLSAQLTLAHFWELPVYSYNVAPHAFVDVVSTVEEAANEAFDKALSAVRSRFPSADGVFRMGIPGQEILRTIDDLKPDLVVMGTHGRRGLARVLLGSVAEKVVRESPVPVMTVRAR